MKIVFAGLISLILCACAHDSASLSAESPQAALPVTTLNPSTTSSEVLPATIRISFLQIAADERFKAVNQNHFYYKISENAEMKLFRHEFANSKDALGYMFNRRMQLHRNFQDSIAPYVGVLQSNQFCIEKVDTKGELISVDNNTDSLFLIFPITNKKLLSDCLENDVWGITQYRFYRCKKTNEVFEVRFTRTLESQEPQILGTCG
jgi:hypothetical protein